MPRYIDADALLESIPQKYVGFRYAVTNAPTADVVERKTGKWIEAKPMSGRIGKVCSACGYEAYWDSDYGQQLFDWCPYCGAEMEDERREDG